MPADISLFRSLLTRTSTVYFSYHLPDRRLVYVSPAYEQVTGQPVEQAQQEVPTWLAGLHPDDARLLRHALRQALRGEMVEGIELRRPLAGAREQWLCLSVCRERDAAGQSYLSGSVEDITRAKNTSLHAQQFNTKKDATLEILSHDLAAPLVLLQQLTQHLRAETDSPSALTQQLLALMERTCTDGVSLIRDFVDGEFMASVNVDLKRERADLVAWLRTMMTEYQQSQWHTHLQFAFEAPATPLYVSFDINKLQQVFNNLISNAIKFTPDGGRISVTIGHKGEQALVTVADTGVGIPAQWQAVLFDKFTKARRTGLRGEKTNGLGMSIIKTIVELHEGRIFFQTAEGVGTTFSIELPALPA
ncbi:PAS domain S-box protein [Hymenobacter sediminis]|uniref:PAS domain-containing sensor histidine kinase n=1 Tax=Hymenobacter sediminis TaxID=2218621 RepID=UPI000DA67C6D|nr:PAS domain-containing sensor histidine kinase [Hymenobacter sediminis]RPD49583.1 PAS domain S-box protein [Hymenobacter sediminis]